MSILTNNSFKRDAGPENTVDQCSIIFQLSLAGPSSVQSFVASLVGVRSSLKDLQESNDLEVEEVGEPPPPPPPNKLEVFQA